jgi:hypothetical protein
MLRALRWTLRKLAQLRCESQLWVTSDKTRIEHNESALTPIADTPADMDFRCNGSGADILRLPRSRHGIRLGFFSDRAAARAAIEEKYPAAPNVIGVIVGR